VRADVPRREDVRAAYCGGRLALGFAVFTGNSYVLYLDAIDNDAGDAAKSSE
jgi:hypothetical protein